MKNKKGRPQCDDYNTLLAVARMIKADNGLKARRAIVQCLPVCSDTNIRRVQRKWKHEKAYFLNKVSDDHPRVIDRTHTGVSRSCLSAIQEFQASLEKIGGPIRQMQEIQERISIHIPAINSARSLAASLERITAPVRRIQMQERMHINISAINSAKSLAAALQFPAIEIVKFQKFI